MPSEEAPIDSNRAMVFYHDHTKPNNIPYSSNKVAPIEIGELSGTPEKKKDPMNLKFAHYGTGICSRVKAWIRINWRKRIVKITTISLLSIIMTLAIVLPIALYEPPPEYFENVFIDMMWKNPNFLKF